MNCPNCGAYLGPEDQFCGECGQPVNQAAASSQQPSPAEVKDLETDLLDVPAAVPSRPAAPPVARQAGARRRTPVVPVLIAVVVAALGLCLCAGAAFVWFVSSGTPTPTLVVAGGFPSPTPAPVVLAPAELYSDDFADPASGWDKYRDEETWAEYVDGGYRLGVVVDNFITWGNPVPQLVLTDYEVEVDTLQVEGPLDNNLGVIVRYQEEDQNFYWFEISSDGYYAVDLMQDGEWQELIPWAASDAIRQGLGVTNQIRVVCDGSQFTFYVNGTYLVTVTDDTYSSGGIGLAAGTFDEPGVVIEFDNLRVRGLE